MDEPAMLDLVDRIYGAVTDRARWPAALEKIGESFGGASILLGKQHFSSGMQQLMSCRIPDEAIERFAVDFSRPDRVDWIREVPEIALAQPITPEMYEGEDSFLSSPLYNEVFRPFGLRYLVTSILYREADWGCFFALVRPPEAGPYAPSELERLGWISQHLARAMALQNALQGYELSLRIVSEVVDRFDRAAIVCGADGRIRFANSRALLILQRADGLVSWRDRIRATRPDDSARLQHLIAEAASTSAREGTAPGGALRIARGAGAGHYPVIVSPMLTIPESGAANRLALLLVSDPDDASVAAPERIAELHDLTPAEARVAARLLLGETPAEAAAALGVSVATIRFHLRNLFAKTGTRRQAELVTRLKA